jgi:septal ring factor EnvC (AmiA/AmiB activator)
VALGALRERLVAMYEQGSPEVLDMLIGEGDLEDIEARAEYLDRIHAADEATAQRVSSLRDGVALTVERRAAAKGEIEASRNSIAAEGSALIATRGELRGRQADLVDARGARERRRPRSAPTKPGSTRTSKTSRAGSPRSRRRPARCRCPGGDQSRQRLDDLAGRRADRLRLRPADDRRALRVPPGDRHRGAGRHADPRRPGGHESEAESGGYGNYTCIDHGGGLSTCHAHQSAFAVNPGQPGQQGEVIGYSGCTGYCLGPHVHFEVRINGEVTDPLSYL